MKFNQIKSVFTAMFLFIAMALAGLGADTNAVPSKALYRANEFSVATFASYQVSGAETGDSAWGVGLQADAFITRNLGVTVSTSKDQFDEGAVLQNFTLAPVFRLPIADTGFSPYVTGGIGFVFGPGTSRYYFAGAGLEYRFTPNVGAFADYQYVFRGDLSAAVNDAQVVRSGLRWTF